MKVAGGYEEARILRAIQAAIGGEADLALHRNQVGGTEEGSTDAGGVWRTRHVTYGLGTGSPDLAGWITVETTAGPIAVAFALEVKSPTGRLSEAQRAWHEEHRRRGVLVYVVRSVAEARSALEDARQRVRAALGRGRAA